NGFRTATSLLDLRKTSFQIPMSLSGGVGFQSTQVIPKSYFPAAKTSSAMAFTLPGCKYLLTSNSYERYVPATSFASANLCPFFASNLAEEICSPVAVASHDDWTCQSL